MANKILNLIFKATDKASPVIDDITGATGDKGIGGMTAALEGLITPATIAAGSIVLVGGAVADMMKDWQDHVIGIGEFASVLGITTEEASGLVGIADDYDMSIGDMLTAMEKLVDAGLTPTIEGLGAAKDLIEGAEDPTKRLETAFDLLGKKGAEELIPMFDDFPDVLEDYITYMGDSEAVTDDMYEAAKEQAGAMNELAGEWAGLKLQAAGWAAPGLTALIQLLTTPFGADSAAAFINKFFGLGPGSLPSGAGERQYTLPSTIGGEWGAGGGGGSGGGGAWVQGGGGGGGPVRGGGSRVGGVSEFATGGRFTVGGFGGPDSTRVSFMGTPGEEVSIGGGTSDMAAMLAELRRLVNMLPTVITDAVERVM